MKQIRRVVFSSLTVVLLTSCNTGKESNINDLSLDAPVISNSFKDEYLNAINRARSSNQICGEKGLFIATSALRWSDKLYGAAYEHSKDMAQSNTFSHNGSGQVTDIVGTLRGKSSTPSDRIDAYGYRWVRYAENIGAGTDIDTAEKSVNQLLKSDGHCANIMNPLLKDVGIAMVKNSSSSYIYYWTQCFGTQPN
jgi:uncharacterized protein YkwD